MNAVRRNGGACSLDDMARAAGVSKLVLYSAFGDKQGVAYAIAVSLSKRLERAPAADLAD